MGARMKKPLWVLFFFVANIVILGGIKFVFRKNSLNLDRESRSASEFVEVHSYDCLRWYFVHFYVPCTHKIV